MIKQTSSRSADNVKRRPTARGDGVELDEDFTDAWRQCRDDLEPMNGVFVEHVGIIQRFSSMCAIQLEWIGLRTIISHSRDTMLLPHQRTKGE
jgi:hypothetical protein